MKTTSWLWLSAAGAIAAGFLAFSTSAAAPSGSGETRQEMQTLFTQGNYKDAYEGFHQLVMDPQTEPRQVGSDLGMCVQCLQRLNRLGEVDALLEDAVKVHKENWRLLAAAAQQYMNIPHFGFIVAGKFVRGQQRSGGNVVNATRARPRSRLAVDGAGHAAGDEGRQPR